MNNTYKTLFILLALVAFSFTSCKDDDTKPEPDVAEVEFTFTSPVAGKMYGKGDTIHIAGMIKWENEMHGYEFTLRNESADSIVHTGHMHKDSKMIHVHSMWLNDVKSHSDMSLTIDAHIGHDGEKKTSVIDFHCHPM